MIGQFPWDPFPAQTPEPKGPDPIVSVAYRGAVTAADGYRSTRLALRVEGDALRVGNRFVPIGRYRQVAFVAAGNAATSQSLAALHALRDRLTTGLVAGPVAPATDFPFRSIRLPPGPPGRPEASEVVDAIREIGTDLTEEDLFLLLLSPGAISALALPPPGLDPTAFQSFVRSCHERGANAREVALVTRVLAEGAVGGAVAGWIPRADTVTLIVDRATPASLLGGGPVHPLMADERTEARAILTRLQLFDTLPAAAREKCTPNAEGPARVPGHVKRPVLVAGPNVALRGAGDVLFDRKWATRLGMLTLAGGPEAAADAFMARVEEVASRERLDPEAKWKGIAVLAMTTLDVPEGWDEGPALARFLTRAGAEIRRRELSVGILRTSGPVGSPDFPPAAVVGRPTDPEFPVTAGRARGLRMEPAVTDVGMLVVAATPLVPAK
jgi:glycerate-2-kinase